MAFLSFCGCKGRCFSWILQEFAKKTLFGMKKSAISFAICQKRCTFAPANRKWTLFLGVFSVRASESSAVGSALRSGRRGRAFESPLSDAEKVRGQSNGLSSHCLYAFFTLTLRWPFIDPTMTIRYPYDNPTLTLHWPYDNHMLTLRWPYVVE